MKQAVLLSLPAALLAIRVQQLDWSGVIVVVPVNGTLLFTPPHSRVAVPSPFIVQLSTTDPLGETCAGSAVKEIITGAAGFAPPVCMSLTSTLILHGGQVAPPQDELKTTMKEPAFVGVNAADEPVPVHGPCPENTDVTVQLSLAGQASWVNILNMPGPQAMLELT